MENTNEFSLCAHFKEQLLTIGNSNESLLSLSLGTANGSSNIYIYTNTYIYAYISHISAITLKLSKDKQTTKCGARRTLINQPENFSTQILCTYIDTYISMCYFFRVGGAHFKVSFFLLKKRISAANR